LQYSYSILRKSFSGGRINTNSARITVAKSIKLNADNRTLIDETIDLCLQIIIYNHLSIFDNTKKSPEYDKRHYIRVNSQSDQENHDPSEHLG